MAYLDYDENTTGEVALIDKIKVMLAEIYTSYITPIDALAQTMGDTTDEVIAARDGEANLLAQIDSLQADIATVTTEVTNARDGEANLLAQIDDLQTYTAEIVTARGGEANLDTRLDGFDTDIASLTNAELPGQAGNDGKYLSTDGTSASWDDVTKTDVGLANVPNEDATDPANWDPAKTDGNFLVGNGTTFVAEAATTARASLSAAKDPSVQVFTSSGTWTRPTGCRTVKMIVTGGGGSASNDVAGAGGGTAIKILDVSSISSATITVGAAGGDSEWSDGTNTITGGGSGTKVPNIGAGGDLNLRGGDGSDSNGSGDHESVGGSSYWGNGAAYGGGATMEAGDDSTYDGPGPGVVYIEEY